MDLSFVLVLSETWLAVRLEDSKVLDSCFRRQVSTQVESQYFA